MQDKPVAALSETELMANLRILFAVFSGALAKTGYLQGVNYMSVMLYQIYNVSKNAEKAASVEKMTFMSLISLIL